MQIYLGWVGGQTRRQTTSIEHIRIQIKVKSGCYGSTMEGLLSVSMGFGEEKGSETHPGNF